MQKGKIYMRRDTGDWLSMFLKPSAQAYFIVVENISESFF